MVLALHLQNEKLAAPTPSLRDTLVPGLSGASRPCLGTDRGTERKEVRPGLESPPHPPPGGQQCSCITNCPHPTPL